MPLWINADAMGEQLLEVLGKYHLPVKFLNLPGSGL
jgi:hypothetical protein